MKRFMMDDLPTAWSPKNTILYLSKGGMLPLDKFKLLMFVIFLNFSKSITEYYKLFCYLIGNLYFRQIYDNN